MCMEEGKKKWSFVLPVALHHVLAACLWRSNVAVEGLFSMFLVYKKGSMKENNGSNYKFVHSFSTKSKAHCGEAQMLNYSFFRSHREQI